MRLLFWPPVATCKKGAIFTDRYPCSTGQDLLLVKNIISSDMKLEKILDNLNSFEKNAFLKIIDSIISEAPKNFKKIDSILSEGNRDLKNIDNLNIAKVFHLLEDEFAEHVQAEFQDRTNQLDILTDIVARDGNCLMKLDWFARLYDKELESINRRIKLFANAIADEKSDIPDNRKRDYSIYKACLHTAYHNDEENNQECKITCDEQSILNTLAKELGLSPEEVKLIHYNIIPVVKLKIEDAINNLKSSGLVFFSKKFNTLYVADEVVRILRKLRGKEVADKFVRRVLRLLREPQINLICRKHNINWREPLDVKLNEIIKEGISLTSILKEDIHREETSLTERKKIINGICDNGLRISPAIKGVTLEEKIENLIKHFEAIERDEKVGISFGGYEKLLNDLDHAFPALKQTIKAHFEFQEEHVLNNEFLLNYNIKPRDVLELIPEDELLSFCKLKNIKSRGEIILNILDAYKDSENLYLENYTNIGFRNLAALKENGIIIKEAEIGVRFEELTKTIFSHLNFDVDEKLRKEINTAKDKIDIILNLGNNDLILIECKTVKESGYNRFSAVSRQLKAYTKVAEKKSYKVVKSILVAPDFSDDFIKDCGLEYELNLSLITASSLKSILDGFKASKLKQFPYNLFMRDVLIQESMVLKAISK